ncbi:MAG: hypothetical protein IH589_10600 [Anaerolineales bacterium]|nr:hypothetical protein [Anaerolineales bacterium]
MKNQAVRELLVTTGLLLISEKHPQVVSGEIRSLQEKLKNVEDESLRCLIFMLNLIVDDIFFNISGDNGYNNTMYDTRDNIFRQIGKTLIEIGEAVIVPNELNVHNSLCELINVYTLELKNINLAFDKGREHVAN